MIDKIKKSFQGWLWDIAKPKLQGSAIRFVATGGLTGILGPKIQPMITTFCTVTWPIIQTVLKTAGIEFPLDLPQQVHINMVTFYGTLAFFLHLLVAGGHDAWGLALQNLKAGKQLTTEETK